MNAHATPYRSSPDAAPLSALYERVRTAMRIQPRASPRTGVRLAVAWIVAPLLSATVLLVASRIVYAHHLAGLEVDPQAMPRMLIALSAATGLAVAATLVALWRGRTGLGLGVVSIGLAVALVAPIYSLLVLKAPAHVPDPFAATVYISPSGGRCLVISAIVGAGVLAIFTAALRHAVPVASRLRGAAIGTAAGAWAGLTVLLFCPSNELEHILLGHVLPIAVLKLAGWAFAPAVLKP